MKRLMIYLLASVWSISAMAVTIPTVEEGAEEYNEKMCVERYENNCISTVCLTSEERDCQDICRQDAIDKCKEMNVL